MRSARLVATLLAISTIIAVSYLAFSAPHDSALAGNAGQTHAGNAGRPPAAITIPSTSTPTPEPTATPTPTPTPTPVSIIAKTRNPTQPYPTLPTPTAWATPSGPAPTPVPCPHSGSISGGGVTVSYGTRINLTLSTNFQQVSSVTYAVSNPQGPAGVLTNRSYHGITFVAPTTGYGSNSVIAFVKFKNFPRFCSFHSAPIYFPPTGQIPTLTPAPTQPSPSSPGTGGNYVCNTPWGTFPSASCSHH